MATLNFQVVLAQYLSGKRRFHNVMLDQIDGFECDLRQIELVNAVLSNVYLPYGNLSRADLRGLIIKGGNLGDVNLFSANLTGANLVGVNLSRADLRCTCLKGADLRKADLSSADLQEADLNGADLREANLTGANLSRAQLNDALLQGAKLFRSSGGELSVAVCDRTTILPDGHYYDV